MAGFAARSLRSLAAYRVAAALIHAPVTPCRLRRDCSLMRQVRMAAPSSPTDGCVEAAGASLRAGRLSIDSRTVRRGDVGEVI